jgi:uncharacterized membrane protein
VIAAIALGVFLSVVGASHFLIPDHYVRLVPPWLPWPRALVLLSGALEVVVGVGLLFEASRLVAALAATALMLVCTC